MRLCQSRLLSSIRSLSLFLTLFRTRTSYALFLFLCVCSVSLFLIERNLNSLKKVNTIFRFPLHTPSNVAKFHSPIGFSCRRIIFIVSITYVDMYVCTYEFTVFIHVCTSVMYLCFCKCGVCVFVIVWVGIGLVQLIESNWKTFHVKTCLFVCLCMYVCTRIGLCACVHAGPQSVGGQQQQKSRHCFNEYRDHFRLCLTFLFFELKVCFFYSVDYSMLHYINPYNNRIFITVFMITYVLIYICM